MNEIQKSIISLVFETKGWEEYKQILRDYERISQTTANNLSKQLGQTFVPSGGPKFSAQQLTPGMGGQGPYQTLYRGQMGQFAPITQSFTNPQGQELTANILYRKTASGEWKAHTADLQNLSKVNKEVTNATDKHDISVSKLGINYGKLALRAIAVIPIWMGLRSVYMAIFSSIGAMIQAYKELDEGMQKVMAVATYTGATQKRVYKEMSDATKEYYRTSIASYKDISEAMYELGSAGRSNEEMIAGLKPIMDLAIGSYTDVKNVARSVAGILNVFGDQFEKLGTTEEQITYITNLLGDTWRAHQIEISEVTEAYKYLGAIAGITGVSFEDFLASVGNMGDAMNRGGRAGRNLADALITLSQKADAAKEWGLIFDPRKPLEFINLMNQLKVIYDEHGKSLENNRHFQEIFGREGSRAIFQILLRWNNWNKDIIRTQESVKGVGEELKKIKEETWGGISTKIFHSQNKMLSDIFNYKDFWSSGLKKYFVALQKEYEKFTANPKSKTVHEIPLQTILKQNEAAKKQNEVQKQIVNIVKDLGPLYENITKKFDYQELMLKRRVMYGDTELDIEKQKLLLMDDYRKKDDEIIAQRIKILDLSLKEQQVYSDIIKTSLEGSINKVFAGTGSVGGVFSDLNKSRIDAYRNVMSTGISKMIMSSGIGAQFGESMLGLKDSIEVAHRTVYNWIVKGHKDGTSGKEDLATSMKLGKFGNRTLPGFGEGGWFNQPVGGGSSQFGGYRNAEELMMGIKMGRPTRGMTRGQMMGGGLNAVLMGYTAYQSGQAGGLSQAGSIVGGVGGALMASGNPYGIVAGAILTVASMFMRSPTGQNTTEIKTTESALSSKIDVTNKSLEVINRNLIGLRTDMRTYILPSSSYWSEKNSLDEEFSLSARRGAY